MTSLHPPPSRIPFFRSPATAEPMRTRMTQACAQVLSSGAFVLGEHVQAFEHQLSRWLDGREVVAVNSGSDALIIALRALGVGSAAGGHADDEVIVPDYTFVACAEAIVAVGARPVFVDSADDDFLPDADRYRRATTPRTRAILGVGLFGDASGLPALAAYCRSRSLYLIEDIAQCFGARGAGTWGDAAAMSFYPSKTLGAAGDAGAVAFRDPAHARRARLLRNHGHDGRTHACLGQNSRMDEMQAALLCIAIDALPAQLERRRTIAARYLAAWQSTTLRLPRATPGHAWNYFVVRLRDGHRRPAFMRALAERGIATRIYYDTPLHRMAAFSDTDADADRPSLANSQRFADCSLALPLYPMLSDEEVAHVVEGVRDLR